MLCSILLLTQGGCGKAASYDIPQPYNVLESSVLSDASDSDPYSTDIGFFAEDLCVAEDKNTVSDRVSEHVIEAMGVFLPASGEISYQKNIHEKMYPASTTKIMTAYLAYTYGNLDDFVTISERACDQASDSSICGYKKGDVVKLSDLLYGLMLRSGNDAAVAIAEHISGSVEEFVELMNKTALEWGATNTHFVNPNGLHDEDHYTTVYDMYIMFYHALENENFKNILSVKSITSYYTSIDGVEKSFTWTSTNKYINGEIAWPNAVTVIGGKTGTTNPAGYCLVLYSENTEKKPVISIIFKSGSRSDVYYVMNQLLTYYSS